jgi:hypothetical protein
MSRAVQWSVLGSIVVAALIALAGCGHYFNMGERGAWRRDAEVACLNSGAVKDGPERVRISSIDGPGICGMDFPIRVSELGDNSPLGYDDEALRPPGAVPDGALPQHWPIQSNALPPPSYPAQSYPAQSYPPPSYNPPSQRPTIAARATPSSSAPMSLHAPGVPEPAEDDAAFQPEPPRPYGNAPAARSSVLPPPKYPPPDEPPPTYTPRALPPADAETHVPLGWPRNPVTAGGPVEIKPAATLACPIVSALDQWIATAVQPAARHWFHQPVVEIKQISAYSCRGMNGNPNAHISEHAFGNALDIAEFTLADGHRVSVQYGWRGSPEEQGFLHDVQLAACESFTTVLAPGANIYHYNHIHVDLMRRASGRHICEPAAIPGEIVAERARARYAAQHFGEPVTTGSIGRKGKREKGALGYSVEDDDRLPDAVPGED